jgi:hypothetical protein
MGVSTTGGAAQDGAYARRSIRDLAFSGSLEIEEAVMVHWPKTVYGNLILLLLTLAITPILVWAAVSLSGPLVWAALSVVGLALVALAIRRRRIEAARERAWVGAFSFGDVIDDMRAREAGQVAAELSG